MPKRELPLCLRDLIAGFRGSAVFLTSLQQNLSINDNYTNTQYPYTVFSPYGVPNPAASRSDAKPLLPLILPSALHFGLTGASSNDRSSSPARNMSSHGRTLSDTSSETSSRSQCPEGVRIFLAQSYNDKADALRLLAQTVAEQRLLALKALLTHPLHVLFTVIFAFATRTWFGASITTKFGTYNTLYLCLAVLTAIAAAALFAVSIPYSRLAEAIGWDWLGQDEIVVAWRDNGDNGDDEKDEMSRGEIVGVAVLAWRANEGRLGRKGRRVGRAWVRGWSIDKLHANSGIGRALLGEAVRTVNCRGGDGIYFHDSHAHSALVLPPFYSGPFMRRDLKAQETLAAAWENRSTSSRRRNSNR